MNFIKKTFTLLATTLLMFVLCLILNLGLSTSSKADSIYVSEETGRTYGVHWNSNTSFGILNQTDSSRVCVYAYLDGLQYSIKSVEILRNGTSIGKWTLNTDDRFIYVYIRFMNSTSLQTDSGALYFQATVPNSWYNSTFKIIVNGFWSSPSYTLSFYDAVAPTYSSYSGGSSSWAKSRTLSISGASDKHSGLASSAYCFYSSSSTSAPGSGSCSWQSSSSKTISSTTNTYYHAYLRDGSGNISYAGYQQVKVDTTAPTITVSKTSAWVTSGTPAYVVDSTATYIKSTMADSHSGHKDAIVYIKKAGASSYTSYSYIDFATLYATSSYFASGINYLYFYASDNAGNTATSSTYYFYLDETHPTLTVSCVGGWCSSGYGADTSSNYIKANVSDTYSGISTIRYCYIKKPGESSYTRYTFDDGVIIYGYNSFLASGINYMYFYAEDIAGNTTTSSTYTLYLDESHPTFSMSKTEGMQLSSSATEKYYVDNTSSYISATISDTLSGLNTSYIYVKKAGASSYSSYSYSSATKIYATSSYFATGANYIYFYATDKAGNTSQSSTYVFYLDETHPTVSVSSTDAWKKQYVAASVANNIKATITDGHSGLAYSFVYVKKAGASSYTSYAYTSGTAIHASSSYFATGINYIYFTGTDGVGNITSTSGSPIAVYVDKTAPVVDINKVFDVGNIDFVNETITVPVSKIDDEHSGLSGSSISSATTLSNSGIVNSDNNLVFGFNQISNQKLTFTVTVRDAVGNTATQNVEVGVTWEYDDSLEELLNEGLSAQKWEAPVSVMNNGKQLSYSLPANVEEKLNKLSLFGIDPHIEDLEIKYVYAVVKTEKGLSDASIANLYTIAKETSFAEVSNLIVSPVGLMNNVDEHIEVIVYINGIGQVVGKGAISTIFETALTSTFDLYTTEVGTYEGAGLGEDGTVVSYTDDTATSRAVTLGASNTINKRDVYGNLEWSKKVTATGRVEIKKIINNDNGILILGETTSGNINGTVYPVMGGRDILVIRMDKLGNTLFTTVVGTTGSDYVVDGDLSSDTIAILSNNNEKSGSLITMGLDGSNPKLRKISSENDMILSSVGIFGSKVAVLGMTSDKRLNIDNLVEEIGNTGERDIFVQLFDGETGWVRRIGGVDDEEAYSIAMDENHIYVAAQTRNVVINENTGVTKLLDSYGGKDGLILKYDYLGNLVQTTTVGGENDDTFNQIIVEGDNIVIAGLSGSREITASHFMNNSYNINLIGELDTMIITLNKEFIIQGGLNLAGKEGELVQEIGIHQYTEQVMVLSATGVSTQRLLEKSFTFDHTYENGILSITGSSAIASAMLVDGDEMIDITNGYKVAPGAYEVRVRSVDGHIVNKVITIGSEAELLANLTTTESKVNVNYTNVIAIPAVSLLIVLLVILNVLKQKKNLIVA